MLRIMQLAPLAACEYIVRMYSSSIFPVSVLLAVAHLSSPDALLHQRESFVQPRWHRVVSVLGHPETSFLTLTLRLIVRRDLSILARTRTASLSSYNS